MTEEKSASLHEEVGYEGRTEKLIDSVFLS